MNVTICSTLQQLFWSLQKTFNKAGNETFDKTALDEIKAYDPYQFKIESLLPEWLE